VRRDEMDIALWLIASWPEYFSPSEEA
jgi:hypothetical protein